ncbi:chromosome segregation protein SMC [Marivirga sp. S37H4]|uniref:Chromosome segregation protein SMC n=1 Tax=Marivirga aurantiaca TaxID=2802615 RepID=A0A935C5P6_9BACT|nr:chromosome segregation protein SMC [Marivirga aurantiaca]MBK6263981.1 chromosome segregation protein SMC [Marivirga aurantiaca]
MTTESSGNKSEEFRNTTKNTNKKAIIIAFIIIIAAVVGIKFYLDEANRNDELQTELETTYGELDSISKQLDEKIADIEKLGGDVTELQLIRKTLEDEKEELRKSNNWAANQIKKYQDKVGGYEELLTIQDEKIKKLEEVNKKLLSENTTLKTEKNILNDSIYELKSRREELVSKVAKASRLKAENIKVLAVNSRGKEREDEFKPRHIDKIKVTFNLAENNVAQPEGKNIILRVLNPKGKELFDVTTGSGSFMRDGKEMFYTAKQEILFDNTQQQLSFVYNRGEEYEEGVYEVELYADDYVIGKSKFVVK